MIIDPQKISQQENYKLLVGSVLPRPIAFVSTLSGAGEPNLAPFSFFTVVASKPPTICFCPSRRGSDGGKKDTLHNVEATGEFVVNIVSEDIAVPMNDCATDFPPGINEFEMAGLTPVASEIVKPYRVKESLIQFECKLHQIVYVGPEGAGGGALVLGEVVLFHVDDQLLDDRMRIDTTQLNPIGRLAGMEYTKLGERFTLVRKKYEG